MPLYRPISARPVQAAGNGGRRPLRIMLPSCAPRRAGIRPVDNPALARVFGEIADLLEIKGENPFKIRAYRNAAETVAPPKISAIRLSVAGVVSTGRRSSGKKPASAISRSGSFGARLR